MVAHLTDLMLRRLAQTQDERLATHVVGVKGLPAAVRQEVVRKTNGVPLLAEERIVEAVAHPESLMLAS